ncbi:uncharacterized protein B0P05DRAFT_553230 [Gilbertella persicaria]|uniref:uncharacterized protein n=1 Tax=Gilbertella persicaria TaxID=101096 RepID=UPI0022202C35|nr:uncharacterized protein B0P05DRAFT_553230 [Gilbertella persicaria]KAI8067013.1 hypothetical protein B0P05DRAFT_553230 [Gilbertella persicaria]
MSCMFYRHVYVSAWGGKAFIMDRIQKENKNAYLFTMIFTFSTKKMIKSTIKVLEWLYSFSKENFFLS